MYRTTEHEYNWSLLSVKYCFKFLYDDYARLDLFNNSLSKATYVRYMNLPPLPDEFA